MFSIFFRENQPITCFENWWADCSPWKEAIALFFIFFPALFGVLARISGIISLYGHFLHNDSWDLAEIWPEASLNISARFPITFSWISIFIGGLCLSTTVSAKIWQFWIGHSTAYTRVLYFDHKQLPTDIFFDDINSTLQYVKRSTARRFIQRASSTPGGLTQHSSPLTTFNRLPSFHCRSFELLYTFMYRHRSPFVNQPQNLHHRQL